MNRPDEIRIKIKFVCREGVDRRPWAGIMGEEENGREGKRSTMKLTVLGGGGVRSPFLTKSIALGAQAAGITEVVLMDSSAAKLYKYGKIAKLVGERCNPALHFMLTTDAEEALRDADYIITTIRGDADEGRVFDERTALSHGVLGL